MSRYVTMARRPPPQAYWDQTMPPLAHPLVYPLEAADTGLLNADGAPIYKMPDPIGFLADHQRDHVDNRNQSPQCRGDLVPLHDTPAKR